MATFLQVNSKQVNLPTTKQEPTQFKLSVFEFKSKDFYKEQVLPHKAQNDAKIAELARLEAIKQAKVVTYAPKAIEPVKTPVNDDKIIQLGYCESGLTANKNTGNGFYGAFQFTISTWNSMATGYARADLAPLDVQIDAVKRLLARSSAYTQFPACARKIGF